MINQIRLGLGWADSDINTSAAARLVLNKITEKFNEEFGTGCAGTVFSDHENGGPFRRLKDFQLKTMIASALDPRTKKMVTKVSTLTCSTHQPSRPSLAWRRCVPLSAT